MLAVIGYRDLDDAVRIANESIYGLSGRSTAPTLRRRLPWPAGSGVVRSTCRTSMFSAYAPSGGYKQSGLGRERAGRHSRLPEIKHLCIGELPPESLYGG